MEDCLLIVWYAHLVLIIPGTTLLLYSGLLLYNGHILQFQWLIVNANRIISWNSWDWGDSLWTAEMHQWLCGSRKEMAISNSQLLNYTEIWIYDLLLSWIIIPHTYIYILRGNGNIIWIYCSWRDGAETTTKFAPLSFRESFWESWCSMGQWWFDHDSSEVTMI